MPSANIAYSNLRAEMARKGITILEISKKLGVERDTAGRKLSGKSQLYLREALTITKMFFSDNVEAKMKYLFSEIYNQKAG